MRLPTITAFNNQMQQMSTNLQNISTYQQQISSGKKLKYSSDDPVAGERIKNINNLFRCYIRKVWSHPPSHRFRF
jgi:flagellin-like hook-associated protein FlgL